MTMEEFDRIASKLSGEELIEFINEHLEVAEAWTNQILREISYMDVTLDEATSREIWNGITERIERYEKQREQGYFMCFKTIFIPK